LPRSKRVGHTVTALGEFVGLIRAWRRLTQEALAKGMGEDDEARGDKGYISRVETGHIKHPKPPTLRRIARGLRLGPYEAHLALRIAGYQAWAGETLVAPDEPARRRVVDALRGEWLGDHGVPLAALIDLQGTIWYATESFARLFSTMSAAALVGCHLLELCLDPRLGMARALAGLVAEADQTEFVARGIAVFRLASLADGATRWRRGVLARLEDLPAFGRLWNAPQSYVTMTVDGLYRLPLAAGGSLLVVTLPVVIDPRFLLLIVTPSADAAALIERRLP
jgi:transcriptional regulator with XRE-family HTH domain